MIANVPNVQDRRIRDFCHFVIRVPHLPSITLEPSLPPVILEPRRGDRTQLISYFLRTRYAY